MRDRNQHDRARTRGPLLCLAIGLCLAAARTPARAAPPEAAPPRSATIENALLTELTERGIRLQSGQQVRLPKPMLPDGLDSSQQGDILRKAAGKHPFDRFLRNSVVGPFSLEIESVQDTAGKRDGQRVDFYFVAYGTLEKLISDELLGELAGAQETRDKAAGPINVHALTEDELRARKLVAREDGELVESYVAIDVPILDRVQLSGVGVGIRQKGKDSVLGAWKLDERFADDNKFPNRWRPIERDQLGKTKLGPPTPYSGLGGYIKVTRLHEPAGALLVECHAAFDEPQGWFDGKNLLRSKLPLVVQENVRTFRRKLAKVSGEKQ